MSALTPTCTNWHCCNGQMLIGDGEFEMWTNCFVCNRDGAREEIKMDLKELIADSVKVNAGRRVTTSKADEFRTLAERSGGRELIMRQMTMDAMETSARFGRLSHQVTFSGDDRQYVGPLADWLHEQGFLCAVTEDGPITQLLVSWGGK
jgi:hypothetical protein